MFYGDEMLQKVICHRKKQLKSFKVRGIVFYFKLGFLLSLAKYSAGFDNQDLASFHDDHPSF